MKQLTGKVILTTKVKLAENTEPLIGEVKKEIVEMMKDEMKSKSETLKMKNVIWEEEEV